jgi:hypothetical protein
MYHQTKKRMAIIYTIVVCIIIGIGMLLITRRVEGTIESVRIIVNKQKLVVGYTNLKGKKQKKTIYKGIYRRYKVGDKIKIRVLRWE